MPSKSCISDRVAEFVLAKQTYYRLNIEHVAILAVFDSQSKHIDDLLDKGVLQYLGEFYGDVVGRYLVDCGILGFEPVAQCVTAFVVEYPVLGDACVSSPNFVSGRGCLAPFLGYTSPHRLWSALSMPKYVSSRVQLPMCMPLFPHSILNDQVPLSKLIPVDFGGLINITEIVDVGAVL
jgi:hypothetical protein